MLTSWESFWVLDSVTHWKAALSHCYGLHTEPEEVLVTLVLQKISDIDQKNMQVDSHHHLEHI